LSVAACLWLIFTLYTGYILQRVLQLYRSTGQASGSRFVEFICGVRHRAVCRPVVKDLRRVSGRPVVEDRALQLADTHAKKDTRSFLMSVALWQQSLDKAQNEAVVGAVSSKAGRSAVKGAVKASL